MDSTTIKVHPDGTGAPKKTARKQLDVPGGECTTKIHPVAANALCALILKFSPEQAGPGLKRNPRVTDGFTFVELTVVIAVIAVLAALLLPAFSSARGKAQRTTCLNNLRQINLGVRMYSDDSHDASPSPGDCEKNFPKWQEMEWIWARQPAKSGSSHLFWSRAKPISLVDLGEPDNEAQIHSSPDLVTQQPPFRKVFFAITLFIKTAF